MKHIKPIFCMSLQQIAPFGHGRFPNPRTASGRLLMEIKPRHSRRQLAPRFLVWLDAVFNEPKIVALSTASKITAVRQICGSPKSKLHASRKPSLWARRARFRCS